jgi:hypothetical protein
MSETRFKEAKSNLSFSQSLRDKFSSMANMAMDAIPANTISYAGPPEAPVAPQSAPQPTQTMDVEQPAPRFQSEPIDLPTGKARTLPKNWAPYVKTAYEKNPNLPKGLIQAILQQESSMGSNDASYNPQIGESAWLGGFTQAAKDELKRRTNQDPDLHTQDGVIQSIAQYLSLVKDRHNDKGEVVNTIEDPTELYNNFYKTASGHKLTDAQLKHFKAMVEHYAKE